MKSSSLIAAQSSADIWNANHTIGTPVMRYKLIDPLREGKATVTRSLAYVADAGYPVVFVVGVSGYVTLDSVVPIDQRLEAECQ